MGKELAIEDHAELAELAEHAERGESIALTKDGRTIATLVPAPKRDFAAAQKAIDRILSMPKVDLGGRVGDHGMVLYRGAVC